MRWRFYPVVGAEFVGLGVGVRSKMDRSGRGRGRGTLHLLRTNPAAGEQPYSQSTRLFI